MRRTTATLAIAAILLAATPTLAQESPGFGALVGGLVGGAIDAAAAGRRPHGGDFVPGRGEGAGKSGGGGHADGAKAGAGGQHRQAQAAGGEHKGPQAGGGGQVHRKQGK